MNTSKAVIIRKLAKSYSSYSVFSLIAKAKIKVQDQEK